MTLPCVAFAGTTKPPKVSENCTVTAKLFVDTLRAPSFAVQVTVVVPTGNSEPLAGLQTTDTALTASVAVGAVYDTEVPATFEVVTVTFAAVPITGAVVSRTSTEKLDEAVLFAASKALHATRVLPSGNVEPLAGEQATDVTPTASLADGGAKVIVAPAALVASAVRLVSVAIVGAVTSLTLTLNDAVPTLPAASWAVQLTVVDPTANVVPLAGEQLCDVTATASVAETL
jgi:hypothetical protein